MLPPKQPYTEINLTDMQRSFKAKQDRYNQDPFSAQQDTMRDSEEIVKAEYDRLNPTPTWTLGIGSEKRWTGKGSGRPSA